MNYLDYSIIAVYIISLLLLGRYYNNSNSGQEYFLGGKSFGWASLSLSTIATQLSAISFISAPAFVGLKEGGGMQWLTYEFAVPFAMLFLIMYFIPPMYKAGIVSVYEYLERRFSASTRILISSVFQISRAFATSVMIYAVALILGSVMDFPMWQTILIIGAVTLFYSYQGGMKAVVYGDVIQMILLFGGIIICFGAGLYHLGGWSNFVEQVDVNRLDAVNFQSMGLQKGDQFGFWPMLLGGFFLYVSYYGTDQTQVQRLFAAQDMPTVKKTLLANGLLRFPITFTYCVMGLIIGTLVTAQPSFRAMIPVDKPDLMIPIFIREYLPHGLIGVLMVAIFSAAMSSLSSGINSLSAATLEDFFNRKKQLSDESYMRHSKYITLFWGVVCILLAFFTGNIADTVIEAINKIGSVFYGPILATFIAGIGIRKINTVGINIGIASGVMINLYLWLFEPSVFWFWWNAIGASTTLIIGYFASLLFKGKQSNEGSIDTTIKWEIDIPKIIILIGFFIAIVLLSMNFKHFFE